MDMEIESELTIPTIEEFIINPSSKIVRFSPSILWGRSSISRLFYNYGFSTDVLLHKYIIYHNDIEGPSINHIAMSGRIELVDCSSYYCFSILQCDRLNRNNRFYIPASKQLLYRDEYIKSLFKIFIESRPLKYYCFPVKNEFDNLLPYKEIVYPWDWDGSKAKVGDSVHDIYEKSRRCHYTRC